MVKRLMTINNSFFSNFDGYFLNEQNINNIDIGFIEHKPNRYLSISKTSEKKGAFIDLGDNRRSFLKMALYSKNFLITDWIKKNYQNIGIFITEKPIQELAEILPQFIVENTWEFYKKLAMIIRNEFKNTVITVTGSVGKSTTRLMMVHLLQAVNQQVLTNDQFGSNTRQIMPNLVSQLLDNPDYSVIEVSINALNNRDGGAITPVIKSNIAVITQIGGAHLGELSHLEDPILFLASRKARIFEGMAENGIAVINKDIEPRIFEYLVSKATEKQLTILTYSIQSQDADAFLVSYNFTRHETRAELSIFGEKCDFLIGMPSDGIVSDLLAAALIYKHLGYPLQNVKNSMRTFKSLENELREHTLEINMNQSITLLDDTHGSTILSAKNALTAIKHRGEFYQGHKVAILDTGEDLGEQAAELNMELLTTAMNSGLTEFIGYGDNYIKPLVKALTELGYRARWIPTLDKLEEYVLTLPSDSLILVKSSDGRKAKYGGDLWTFPKLLMNHFDTKN